MDWLIYFYLCWCLVPLGFFWSSCLCCGCAHVLIDTFDRADSSDVGSNWMVLTGTWSILSNKLRTSSAGAFLRCALESSDADHSVSVTVKSTAVGDVLLVAVRYTDASNYDYARVEMGASSSTLELWTVRGGSVSQIADTRTIPVVAGASIALTVCATDTMVKVTYAGYYIVSGRTENTGKKIALGTNALTGNADFDSLTFSEVDNATDDCTACVGCTNCKDWLSSSDLEVVISGITNGTCSQCTSMNGTFIVSVGFYEVFAGANTCTAAYQLPGSLCLNGIYTYCAIVLQMQSTSLSVSLLEKNFLSTCTATGLLYQMFAKSYVSPIDETGSGYGSCFFNALNVPASASGSIPCNFGSATCTVTAL